jgi:energy-coupling factor transport system ATP-binding protein
MTHDMQEPLLRCRDLSFHYPDRAEPVLCNVSLEIQPGQCLCLTGPTGSGKTTLARILSRLQPDGTLDGTIEFSPELEQAALPVGLVLQDPEVQLLASSVGAEVAFGLENLGVEPAAMPDRVTEAVAAVGLKMPLEFPVGKLSMGQKYRLLMASLLVMESGLLILDEPGAQLDPEGLRNLQTVLKQLKYAGIAIVLCEHRPEPLLDIIDEFRQLSPDGCLRTGRWTSHPEPPAHPLSAAPEGTETLLNARGLNFDDPLGRPVLQGIGLSVRSGERVIITGLNGCGKTTLLRCLAGFLKPRTGVIDILGGPADPQRLRGRLGLLFQNPGRQLFENTVREEVAFTLKRVGVESKKATLQADHILAQFGISHLADSSPHKLSYGQKHLVALAAVTAPCPEMLLLDDPLAGLDANRSRDMVRLLADWSDQHGMAMLWTSHEPSADFSWAHRVLHLEEGRLVEI